MRSMKKNRRGFVEVKCVTCGRLRKIFPGEVLEVEQPLCDLYYSPMIPTKAKIRRKR